jgi:phospholipase/carboxylesterase
MVPLVPEKLPNLSERPVFLAAGRHDPIILPENTERLAAMLKEAGASVSLKWSEGGHQLNVEEVDEAKHWLVKAFAR